MDLNFIVLPGAEITTAELTVGPPDAENQVYDAGTTYVTADLVWYGGNAWKSLVDSNTGNTPVEGASWTDLGEVDQGAIKWTAGTYNEDDYTVHNSVLWKSAVDSNTDTPGATIKWTNYGPTNRFKAFDTFLDDSTSGTGNLKFVLDIPSRVTEMVILKPVAGSVTVTVNSASAGEVFNQTYRTTRDSGGGWWKYFTSRIRRVGSVTVEGLPPYSDATITVEFTGADDAEVSVGQIVAGFASAAAVVTTGTGVGMTSYSIKDTNEFGRPIIVGYPPAKLVNFAVKIPTLSVDDVAELLFEREAKPTAFYMRDGSAYGTVVYGLFDDFYIDHSTSAIAESVVAIQGFS